MRSVVFLDVRFDDLSEDEVVARIFDALRQQKGTRRGKILVTPNMDFLTRMYSKESDVKFIDVVRNAEFCLCDSRVLRMLAYVRGTSIDNVVTGSDLTRTLMRKLEKTKRPVAIIGPSDQEIDTLQGHFAIDIVDHECPPYGFMSDGDYVEALCDRLARSDADIVFMAVGSPRQELLASKLVQQGSKAIILCIGASIDFLTGKERRAPAPLQKMHLEWLFRLSGNPRRLGKRYLFNFVFLLKVLFGVAGNIR